MPRSMKLIIKRGRFVRVVHQIGWDGGDLNPHAITGAATSTQCVCQFRHHPG